MIPKQVPQLVPSVFNYAIFSLLYSAYQAFDEHTYIKWSSARCLDAVDLSLELKIEKEWKFLF